MTRIEFAQRDDAFVLGALNLRADLEGGADHRDGFIQEFADAWLRDYDNTPTWLAFADHGAALGYVQASLIRKLPSLRRPATSWMHVKGVFVVPDARGEGVAGQMLNEMFRWGAQHGVERYQLNAEDKARTLYERAGFTAPDHRLMIKTVR